MCKRNIDLLPLTRPQPGTWPTTQACALTGNRTGDLAVSGTMPNLLSHARQSWNVNFFRVETFSPISGFLAYCRLPVTQEALKAHWRKQEEEREKGKNGRESSQTHGTHSELLKHLMPANLEAAFIASWSTGGGDEKYIHLESGRLDLCLSSSPSCVYASGGLT